MHVQVYSKEPLEYAVFKEGAEVVRWAQAEDAWSGDRTGELQFLTGTERTYTNVRKVLPCASA